MTGCMCARRRRPQLFWTTPIGPLRFNFAKALKKDDYDEEQSFDLTISTKF